MSPGRGDNHFNSTMKSSGGRWNNSPGSRNNSYHGGRNNTYSYKRDWNQRHNYSDNYSSRRKLKRYTHKLKNPKSGIRFEYDMRDQQMYPNLRRTIDNLKKEPQSNRDNYKRFIPRFTNRSQEEVREDAIAEISIDEIGSILREDLDLVFDALVISDDIDEKAEA